MSKDCSEPNKRPKIQGRRNDGNRGDGAESDDPPTSQGTSFAGPTSVIDASANEVAYERQTTLFKLIGSRSFAQVDERLGTHPDEAKVWVVTRWANSNGKERQQSEDGDGKGKGGCAEAGTTVWYRRLPLHHLAERKPDDSSLVETLLAANPDALSGRDEQGRVPLVHACIRGASIEVVKVLLGHDVDDGGREGDEGKEGGDVEDAEFVAAAPAAVQDNDGRLALHWACEYGSIPAVVSAVMDANPTAVRHADGYGRLPLHWECLCLKEDAGMVSKLIEAYPESIGMRDADGRAPLELASMNVTSRDREEVIRVLREAGGTDNISSGKDEK